MTAEKKKYWKLLNPPHGMQLPQTKLRRVDVAAIRSAAVQRENLKTHIRDCLSNEALAKKFGVHVRTIEKVMACETHWRVS